MERSERVETIFMDCLFRDEELTDGKPSIEPVVAEGITSNVGFHPGRVEQHRGEIEILLTGFPDEFYTDGGGGWSFLNLCRLSDGTQWTDFHLRMEQLCQLGIATGKVKFQLPREMWSVLPGGMPYLSIDRG